MSAKLLPVSVTLPDQKLRGAIVAAATITFLVTFGCKPTITATAANVAEASDTDSASNADSLTQSGDGADGETVVVRGDLESVNWRSIVDHKVIVKGDLVVVDAYDLVRRGQVRVARKRLYVPTSQIDPNDVDPNATSYEGGSNVAKVVEAQKFNDVATITLDDGASEQNIFPPALFPGLGKSHPTVRIGSIIRGVSGRLVKSGKKIVLVPDAPLAWTPTNRPQRPPVGDADVTVASFNVLNYFTTIDDGNNNARGADSPSELSRQQAKLVAAITALQADIVGLMEIENNLDAERRLVDALNQKIGKAVFKGCGIPNGFHRAPGGIDSIRVGIIYRADRVSPVGEVSMIRDKAFFVARTPIVQTFRSIGGGKPFAVIVNHFKSKGASNADVANKNKGDGQGAYNAARRSQALAITNYIAKQTKSDEPPRILVIGDLNAYQQEDPVDALRAKGLVDLHERHIKQSHDQSTYYSYVYYGQCGSLDHAVATESLASDVTGIATWHINADEPRFLDYNEEYNPTELYDANPYRSSDHDPVLIGIRN